MAKVWKGDPLLLLIVCAQNNTFLKKPHSCGSNFSELVHQNIIMDGVKRLSQVDKNDYTAVLIVYDTNNII